jgi:serine/threonine-protein kinase SRPK3
METKKIDTKTLDANTVNLNTNNMDTNNLNTNKNTERNIGLLKKMQLSNLTKMQRKAKRKQNKKKKKEIIKDEHSDCSDDECKCCREDPSDGKDSSKEKTKKLKNEELQKEYKYGELHPVYIGERFHDRYQVIRKLGWGNFSTVWLVYDEKTMKKRAMKVVKSKKEYTETALDEIKLLECLKQKDPEMKQPVVHLLDHFTHKGPNGTHVCMVFPLLGRNLLEWQKSLKDDLLDIPTLKQIMRQLLQAIDFMHRECKMIHTDLKLENILLSTKEEKTYTVDEIKEEIRKQMEIYPPSNEKNFDYKNYQIMKSCPETIEDDCLNIKLVDFGNACWTNKHFTENIQTTEYRAPEAIIYAPYDTSCDIWSVACIMFEIFTGDLLFKPKTTKAFHKDDDHLAQIEELIGKCPKNFAMTGKDSKLFFMPSGQLKHITDIKYWPLHKILSEKYKMPDAKPMSNFMVKMLQWVPKHRATAEQLLNDDYLKDLKETSPTNSETSPTNNPDTVVKVCSKDVSKDVCLTDVCSKDVSKDVCLTDVCSKDVCSKDVCSTDVCSTDVCSTDVSKNVSKDLCKDGSDQR